MLLGAVIVEGRCRLIDQRGSESAFDFRKRKAMGFQGGNTRSLIELSLRQIAMKISSDIAVTTGRIGSEESLKATRYLKTMLGVAALIAVGLAAIIYMWAINQPVRKTELALQANRRGPALSRCSYFSQLRLWA